MITSIDQLEKEEELEAQLAAEESKRIYFNEQRRRQERLMDAQNTSDESVPLPETMTKKDFFSSCCGQMYSEEAINELCAQDKNQENDEVQQEDINEKKLRAILAAKEDGNLLFKEKKYAEAKAVYEQGTLIVMLTINADEAMSRQIAELELQLNLNITLCDIKAGKHYSALAMVQRILDMNPKVVKAWYRKAQVLIDMQEFPPALEAIQEGMKIEKEKLESESNVLSEETEAVQKTLAEFSALERNCRKKQTEFEEQSRANFGWVSNFQKNLKKSNEE